MWTGVVYGRFERRQELSIHCGEYVETASRQDFNFDNTMLRVLPSVSYVKEELKMSGMCFSDAQQHHSGCSQSINLDNKSRSNATVGLGLYDRDFPSKMLHRSGGNPHQGSNFATLEGAPAFLNPSETNSVEIILVDEK
ncbi:hypothetical protein L195_g035818, partial [Trifolium pratense]